MGRPLQVTMVQIGSDPAALHSSAPLREEAGEKVADNAALPSPQPSLRDSPEGGEKTSEAEEPAPHESANAQDDATTAYLDSAQVSVQPQLLVDVPPTLAQRIPNNLSSVVLRLLINEQGKVDQVLVEQDSISTETRQALIEGFSGLQFRPAQMQEQPVKVQLRIEVSVGNRE